MNVNHAIIHKLIKEQHGRATTVERNIDLSITEPVKKLVLDIQGLYSKRVSKGYGRFESDEINFPSAVILRNVFKNDTLEFHEASKQLLKVLATKADPVAFATGGYVLMSHVITDQNVSWFIVAIINNVDSNAIDDETLEVKKSVHVDLDNVRVAGRVNISDWLSGDTEKRYVSFLKQRGDVADYFKLFLGCNEIIDDTKESTKLVAVLMGFAKSERLDQTEKEEFFQKAYDFCNIDQPLNLEALSNAIWPEDPKKLQSAFVDGDLQIRDGFKPDGRSLRPLTRMKYKTTYWSIDLDRHALSSGYARYNQQKGELVLLNLPEALKAELDTEIKEKSDD